MSRLAIIISLAVFCGVCIGEPTLVVEPGELIFSALEGGVNPESQMLYISNSSKGKLKWELEEDCEWLNTEPTSGEVFGEEEIDEVEVNIDIGGLSAGEYACELTVSMQKPTGGVEVVSVSLTVIVESEYLRVPEDYSTIQAAIDAAVDGETVMVSDGVYTGQGNRDIDFLGKAIMLRSEKGPENCIVECEGPHRGFLFDNNEGSDSILEGFTIINGNTADYYGGGAICCLASSPTIRNCAFTGNHSSMSGGAVYSKEGMARIEKSVFRSNMATLDGGGLGCLDSTAIITDCVFEGNRSTSAGGGGMSYYGDEALITNCVFVDNDSGHYGGGLKSLGNNLTIKNCFFAGNTGDGGGGVSAAWDYASITNCTIVGNSGEFGGGILSIGCIVTVTNSILWGNEPQELLYDSPYPPVITYSDIGGGWEDEGNIDVDPLFVDELNGDYHLMWDSPCVDSGDPGFVPEEGEVDIDGDPRLMGGRVDIGADEVTLPSGPYIGVLDETFEFIALEGGENPEEQYLYIYNTGDGILDWTIEPNKPCDWLEFDPNSGNSSGEVDEVILSVETSGLDMGIYECQLQITSEAALNSPQFVTVVLNIRPGDGILTVPEMFSTIQVAMDMAVDGETIIVADGVYTGEGNRDIDFKGKAVTVRSENGCENCIIDCQLAGRAFHLSSGEGLDSIVEGISITNADGSIGSAIRCDNSSVTVRDCKFFENTYYFPYASCIGCYGEYDLVVSDCVFVNNNGDGVSCVSGSNLIMNCMFLNNSSQGNTGAMSCGGDTEVAGCIFVGNFAESNAGAIWCGGGKVKMTNCVFAGNGANLSGGAIYSNMSELTLVNCTFTGNIAGDSGGAVYCNADDSPVPTVVNCILWDNQPEEIFLTSSQVHVSYSNVMGGWDGEGNIDVDPLFASTTDPNVLGYHLSLDSPCIDAGTNSPEGGLPEFDLDGNERVVDGDNDSVAIVDMGAYEYQVE